jgi:anti-anti-sigma factor
MASRGTLKGFSQPMLSIEHTIVNPSMVLITVKGKLMLGADGGQLERLVSQLLGEGVRHFVMDLSGLTHIDSTGIGRFIASYNLILPVAGSTLRMAAAGGAVRSAFKVTKLDTVFPFFDSVDAAEAAAL